MPVKMRSRKGARSERRLASYAEALSAPEAARGRAFPWSKVAAGVLLITSCLLGYRFLGAEHFRVREIEITGETLLDENEIAARIPWEGHSIFTAPVHRLTRDLKGAFPLLESATVQCILPNRVRITVKEYDVALVWESGGRYWWIGPQGRVLGETKDPKGRMVVHDIKGLAPLPGEYVLGVPWEYILALSRALPELTEVDYALEEGVIAHYGAEGVTILWGYEGDVPTKVAILKGLSAQWAARRAALDYIDLRNTNRPAIKTR